MSSINNHKLCSSRLFKPIKFYQFNRAYIKEPTGKVTTIDLFDNGVFGDTTRNDGVYSRYFVTATSLGRYSVECEISDGGKAYISESFSASSIVVKDPGKRRLIKSIKTD